MTDINAIDPAPRSIAAVERDTGLTKDTLRVWERRYGFPKPGRDAFGERLYPIDQVDKLRVLRRLMDAGHRPGKLIHLPIHALMLLGRQERLPTPAAPAHTAAAGFAAPDVGEFFALIRSRQPEAVRRSLAQALLRLGLERFVFDVASPLTRLIGEVWSRGELEIFDERLSVESLQTVMRGALASISSPGVAPTVMLTTVPGEAHGLGLLMAESLLSLQGCRCLSLGVQTPLWDIVLAARAHHADVLALSFSSALNAAQVIDSLTELREKIPAATRIWAGGDSPALRRHRLQGVEVLAGLHEIAPLVARWRLTTSTERQTH
ncbi:MAG: MerR family transcriptional regulator [Burkholderiales bacterium]|nr:MerR family transcriptional regulator [Burkholderiales bacterium]